MKLQIADAFEAVVPPFRKVGGSRKSHWFHPFLFSGFGKPVYTELQITFTF